MSAALSGIEIVPSVAWRGGQNIRMRSITRSDVASTVRSALREVAGGRLRALPFTLRFWDGSTLPGESPTPVTVVRSPRALAYLLRAPNQVGLARAWVTGTLDVEGDVEAVLAARRRLNGVALSVADRVKLIVAAARKSGAHFEGVLRNHARWGGISHDRTMFSFVPTDFLTPPS